MARIVETVSKEMIKPSSPTPPHLRKLELSFLDQLAPPIFIHMILYYEAPNFDENASQKLKHSFSEALAAYYPLAGRICDNSWVDCNDKGAEFVECHFGDAQLSDILSNSKAEDLKKYVPEMPHESHNAPLSIQLNVFGCEGIAIGICMSHKVGDATSLVAFLNDWSEICRGDTPETRAPCFGLVYRFPPIDCSLFSPPPRNIVPQKIVTRRYMFDEKHLAALKKICTGSNMENPTRVEAVSAFIWKHFIEAVKTRDPIKAKNTIFTATHPVNIRFRAIPSLPINFFGNACARAMAMINPEEQEDSYYNLALKLRNAIQKTDSDYVKRLEDGESFFKYYSTNEENDPSFKDGGRTLEMCSFTSWCKLPAYVVDFGWGKPVQVSVIGLPFKNLIILLGSKSGNGIEAWVNMVEDDMVVLDDNYKLLFSTKY